LAQKLREEFAPKEVVDDKKKPADDKRRTSLFQRR
jgi:hypothetical protein